MKAFKLLTYDSVKFLSSFWKSSYSFSRFKIPIFILVTVEALFIGYWTSSSRPLYHAEKGYLVKNGKQYIVFWLNDEKQQSMVSLEKLSDALRFIHDELELEVATDRLTFHPLEVLWVKNNIDNYYLYWKTSNSQFLNRLTFVSQDEVDVFHNLFKRGAYTPSPIGHSVALAPIKKN